MAEGCMSRQVVHARHYCKRDGNKSAERMCTWEVCPLISEVRDENG